MASCGSQVFIATLFFDHSMSAQICDQNFQSWLFDIIRYRLFDHSMSARPKPSSAPWISTKKVSVEKPSSNFGMDDDRLFTVDVRALRYSQRTCKSTFQSGEPIVQLIGDLFYGKVRPSCPSLTLSVFEAIEPKTHEPILKCIDNRRLYALKEYAKLCDHDDISRFVYVRFFSRRTVREVMRFRNNSDPTSGLDIKIRQGNNRKQSLQGNFIKKVRRSR